MRQVINHHTLRGKEMHDYKQRHMSIKNHPAGHCLGSKDVKECQNPSAIARKRVGNKCRGRKGHLSQINLGTTPHPVTVTTRTITFLIGNPFKPSFVTVTGWGVHRR